MAAVVRVEQFRQTIRADRRVRGHVRRHRAAAGRGDDERPRILRLRGQFADTERVDAGERRRLAQVAKKTLQRRRRTLNFDFHARAVVADKAAQAVPRRQPVNERAEADALNLAAYPNRPALERGHARRCRSRWLAARVSHHRAPAVPAPPPDQPPGG